MKKAEEQAAAAINEEMAPKALKVVDPGDALQYIKKVQSSYSDKPEFFEEFLKTLNLYESQKVHENAVINLVMSLFEGNEELVEGFRQFLPDQPASDKQRLIETPTGDENTNQIPDNIYLSSDDVSLCPSLLTIGDNSYTALSDKATLSNLSGVQVEKVEDKQTSSNIKKILSIEEAATAKRRSKMLQEQHTPVLINQVTLRSVQGGASTHANFVKEQEEKEKEYLLELKEARGTLSKAKDLVQDSDENIKAAGVKKIDSEEKKKAGDMKETSHQVLLRSVQLSDFVKQQKEREEKHICELKEAPNKGFIKYF